MSVSIASIRKVDKEIERMREELEGLNSMTGVVQYCNGETGKAIETVYQTSWRRKRRSTEELQSHT